MDDQLSKSILELISNHEGTYPIYTKEIEKALDISNQKATSELKRLRKQGLIFTREITWITSYRSFHILVNEHWPTFLSTKCKQCHYRSTIRTCIFHNDLHEQGANCELERVNAQFNKDCVGCPWYIARTTGVLVLSLDVFIEKSIGKSNAYVNRTTSHLTIPDYEESIFEEDETDHILPKYHCIFCSEKLYQLGVGFFPLLGSSVFRCNNCESLYKLFYNEIEEKYEVHCAEEFGDLYRHNFEQVAGFPSEMDLYSSTFFGISIPENSDYSLDMETETLIVANWVGKLSSMEYIVTKTKEDFDYFTKKLENDYSGIRIIDGRELLISPDPTLEEIGILKLLRETKLLNVAFCLATLESRKTVLAQLQGVVNEELRIDAIQKIDKRIRKLKRFQIISADDWNRIDMRAANAMFRPIKDFLIKEGIDFPGRVLGRNVKDRFKPYGLFYAYSEIDVIINGLMRITSNEAEQYCTSINLCWDGLPGICHKDTHGGDYAFHLDLIEPFKLASLAILCKAILEDKFDFEKIEDIIGRRRQKLYYVRPKSELHKQLKEQVATALNQKGRKYSVKKELENYFLQVKLWIQGLLENSFALRVSHHGQEFAAWTLLQYQIWQFLAKEQKQQITFKIDRIISKLQII
ncbi:MAG: winged helix-turn-helix domain-containing protein, partial [Candidatus Heimdallarchaeota archaeon]